MNNETTSLGDAIQDEIKRVREIIYEYKSLPGGAGNLAASLMEISINQAVKALAEGDVIAILQSYEDLKVYEL